MLYFKEFYENKSEFDYEELPSIMQDELYVQNLFINLI